MKKLLFLAAIGASFGLAPIALHMSAVAGAAMMLAIAMLAAMAASGALGWTAAAAGALGAFASGMLAPTSPAAAGAALVGLCYAERTLRVRGQSARLLHLGVAVVAGAIAGSLSTSFAASQVAVRGVAMTVGAVLAALPLLVEADDALAHALDGAAEELPDPARSSLHRGAEIRRSIGDAILTKRALVEVKRTWSSLLRLAEARTRLERRRTLKSATPRDAKLAAELASHTDAVVKKLDERLLEHVNALARAYTAVDAATAAEVSLDDEALRSVERVGESLEQMSKAIVEDVA